MAPKQDRQHGNQPVQPADLLKGALGQRVSDLAEKLVFTQKLSAVEQVKAIAVFLASVSNENKLKPEQVVKTLEGMVKSAPFGVPLFFNEAQLRAGILDILGVQDSTPFMKAHEAQAPAAVPRELEEAMRGMLETAPVRFMTDAERTEFGGQLAAIHGAKSGIAIPAELEAASLKSVSEALSFKVVYDVGGGMQSNTGKYLDKQEDKIAFLKEQLEAFSKTSPRERVLYEMIGYAVTILQLFNTNEVATNEFKDAMKERLAQTDRTEITVASLESGLNELGWRTARAERLESLGDKLGLSGDEVSYELSHIKKATGVDKKTLVLLLEQILSENPGLDEKEAFSMLREEVNALSQRGC